MIAWDSQQTFYKQAEDKNVFWLKRKQTTKKKEALQEVVKGEFLWIPVQSKSEPDSELKANLGCKMRP